MRKGRMRLASNPKLASSTGEMPVACLWKPPKTPAWVPILRWLTTAWQGSRMRTSTVDAVEAMKNVPNVFFL